MSYSALYCYRGSTIKGIIYLELFNYCFIPSPHDSSIGEEDYLKLFRDPCQCFDWLLHGFLVQNDFLRQISKYPLLHLAPWTWFAQVLPAILRKRLAILYLLNKNVKCFFDKIWEPKMSVTL